MISFTVDDIIYKDKDVRINVKSNGVFTIYYPKEWSEEKSDLYLEEIQRKYDWPFIYSIYKQFEKINRQPERSKREDSKYCCEILEKLKYIFKDDRLLIDVKKYVNDLIVDCEMRCSEHCSNAVSPK